MFEDLDYHRLINLLIFSFIWMTNCKMVQKSYDKFYPKKNNGLDRSPGYQLFNLGMFTLVLASAADLTYGYTSVLLTSFFCMATLNGKNSFTSESWDGYYNKASFFIFVGLLMTIGTIIYNLF